MPLQVGILGAGMMAQGFDQPGDSRVLSMAHAFSRSSTFALGGFFDVRQDRTAAAEQRWGVAPSPRDRTAWLDVGWDVVYIASPDAQHSVDVRAALARRPRAVLVEKPLSIDPADALALLDEARACDVPLLVNYPRRWHSGIIRLRTMVEDGAFSSPSTAFVAVSGGVVHNLPHVTDLLHELWGGGWRIERPTSRVGEVTTLQWERGAASLAMVVAERACPHYVWEAHFYCPEGKVEWSHSPEMLEVTMPAPHPFYGSYDVLTPIFRMSMEDEELLCRTVDELTLVVNDAAAARRAAERERGSQVLTSAALRCF